MKTKFTSILYFLVFLASSLIYSQSAKLDSLYNHLSMATTAIDSITLYGNIATITTNIDPNESILLSERLLRLSEKNSNVEGIATAYDVLGVSNVYLSNYEMAIDYLEKGLKVVESHGLYNRTASIYNHLGKAYRFKGAHYKSLKYYDKSMAVSKKLNNTSQIAECLKNISVLYVLISEFDTSLEFLEKALVLYKKNENLYGIISIQKNIALIDAYKGNYGKALPVLNEVYHFEDSLGYTYRKLHTRMYIGSIYLESGNFKKAKEEFEYCLSLLNQINNNVIREDCYVNLAMASHKSGDNEKAMDYALKAFMAAKRHQVSANSIETVNLLSMLYEQKNDYEKALEFSRISDLYKDSLKLDKANSSLLKEQLKLDLKEVSLQKEKELHDLKTKKNRYLTIGGFAFFIVVAILIYFSKIKLVRVNKKLRLSNETKSNFLTKMTHEVKTPINAIIGYADLLHNFKDLTTTQHRYISTIKSSGESLLVMAEDIFDFNRYKKNKVKTHEAPTDLRALIEEVFEMFNIRGRGKDVVFQLNISDEISKMFLMDSLKIRRVLYALLDNAFKYTSKGSVSLNVKLLNKYTNESDIEFSVVDTGKGILPENQNKVFEEFYQEESDYTREYGGIGLGLSLSSKIIEMFGSTLQFNSEVGKGSVFYFKVTLTHCVENKQDNLPKSPDEVETRAFKILVVEDNKVNLLLTKKLLSSFYKNAIICEAYNGKMGVDLYKKELPDIILMDIQMPVLNGLEATKIIRNEYYSKIPILALSAGSAIENQKKSMAAGINEYIEKPVDLIRIREILYKYLFAL